MTLTMASLASRYTETFSTRRTLIAKMDWEKDLGGSLDVSVEELRLVLAIVTSVAAGMGIRLLRSPAARHLYATLVGFALVYYPFGAGVGQAIFPATTAFLAMRVFPRSCGVITWCTCFPYLVWLHVISATGMRWTMGEPDFDGGVMVLTLKLICMAVAHQDSNTVKDKSKLSQHAREHLVPRPPSLLEYLGFVFCFGNLLAGPQIEFAKYLEFIEGRGVWNTKNRGTPSPWGHGLRLMGEGFICMAGHVLLMKNWSVALLKTDWYQQQSQTVRCASQVVIGLAHQQKYYMAWKLMESSLTFGGLNFSGWEGDKAVWGRYCNARPLRVWLSPSARDVPQHWNTTTGAFLRFYVYERISPKSGKPGFIHLIVTQMVAGTWHGLFPGYIMFFASTVLYLNGGTVIFRFEQRLLPGFIARSPLWWLIKVAWTDWTLNYLSMAFILLEYHPTINAWGSVGFLPHWIMLGLLVLGLVLPSSKGAKGGKSGNSSGNKKTE